MRGLVAVVHAEIQVRLTHRGSVALGLVHHALFVGGQILLWSSLMGAGAVTTGAGPVTLADMVTYVMLAMAISNFTDFQIVDAINERVARGQAAVDLLRPIGFPMLVISQEYVRIAFNMATRALPVLLLYAVVVGLAVPSAERVLLTAGFVLGGSMIAVMLGWCCGIAAFLLVDTTQVKYALQGLTALLSGALVPLWFFPDALRSVAEWLPFHLVFHAPLSVWLGKAGPDEIARSALALACWIVALAFAAHRMWRWSLDRIVVQGG